MRLASSALCTSRNMPSGRRGHPVKSAALTLFLVGIFALSILAISRIIIQPAEMTVIVSRTAAMDTGSIPKRPENLSPLLDPDFLSHYKPINFSARTIISNSFEERERFHNLTPATETLADSEQARIQQSASPAKMAALAPGLPASAPPAAAGADIPAPPVRPGLRSPRSDRQLQPGRALASNATAPKEAPSILEKLFGTRQDTVNGTEMAYASPNDGLIRSMGRAFGGSRPSGYDNRTAVYDISKRIVYLPDGTRLEAHSGLGSMMDDPDNIHVKMRGATPPHLYTLREREALFHGVRAIRLQPVGGEGAIHGRTGLLAHTYMLGPRGDSNGCVSFKNYDAFLRAYLNGQITQLAVIAGN